MVSIPQDRDPAKKSYAGRIAPSSLALPEFWRGVFAPLLSIACEFTH
jgi:hypothetical protein